MLSVCKGDVMRVGRILRLVIAVAFPLVAYANERDEIARLYQTGLAGDKAAVEPCISKLEAVLKANPSNALARVYLGSAYTLRSRDLGFGPAKLQSLKQGLAVMDAAVAAAPDDPHVRLVRAMTTDALPFFAGRKQATTEDFNRLEKIAKQSPALFTEGDLAVIRSHLH